MRLTLGRQLTGLILLVTISSILPMLSFSLGSTTFWWFVYAASIVVIVNTRRFLSIENSGFDKQLFFVKMLLIWFFICIARGCFVASDYWEWKNLVGTSFAMMIPLIVFLSINPYFVSYITKRWIRIVLPLFFLFFPFLQGDGAGRYLVPVSILFLFFPLLSSKWRLILFGFSLFIFLGSLDARSNLIKFGVPLILSTGIYVGVFKQKKLLRFLYYISFAIPFLLFLLGVLGVFNIFKMDEYLNNGESKIIVENGTEVNLTADTRTPIYEEVLLSSIKNNYYLFGRTPARGNESTLFASQLEDLKKNNTNERFANEVSILNVFTWTGLIGVFLYFMVFAKASYLAIFKSKNQYGRLIGLYIAFRWCYAWVEDFNNFDLSYFYLWVLIGLCYSSKFREMTDIEIKQWVSGIFGKRKAVFVPTAIVKS